MEETKRYCVLMSVYHKEKAAFLREAIQSMLDQTVPPEEFVLVCDGPLPPGLNAVAEEYETALPYFKTVRLSENQGLAKALNAGLEVCTCRYIARMDSDDIALPNRMALQLDAMREHHPVFISGTVLEFETDPEIITGRRALPQTDAEIRRFARRRNPMNHPAVLFDRLAVLEAGGYGGCRLFEDYELWLRLLAQGGQGCNLSEPLVKMRTGNGLYDRRGGADYFRCIRRFERFKHRLGFTSRWEYFYCLAVRGIVCFLPAKLRALVYTRLLRSHRE